jgi:hypothetical protein
VLWYVGRDSKMMFLVQFFDIGSLGGNISQKIHYCIDNSLPFNPALIQIMLGYIYTIYLYKIYFNITIQCVPRSCEWSLPLKISNHNVMCSIVSS